MIFVDTFQFHWTLKLNKKVLNLLIMLDAKLTLLIIEVYCNCNFDSSTDVLELRIARTIKVC